MDVNPHSYSHLFTFPVPSLLSTCCQGGYMPCACFHCSRESSVSAFSPCFHLLAPCIFFQLCVYSPTMSWEMKPTSSPEHFVGFTHTISQNTISVCNFQSMKSPVERNNLLPKFFCYITWFVITWLDPTLDDFQTRPLRQILLFRRNNSFSALKITN